MSAPRVFLVAAEADGGGGSMLEDPSIGGLPVQRREQQLLDAGRSLGAAQTASQSAESPARGGMAAGSLRRVREHIERKLADKIDLGELANIAGLSKGHFSRAFRQSVGMPPHRYLLARRLVAAAHFIRQTNWPIAEIALRIGFADQSHFTRVFARMRGETPAAFRRRHR